MKARGWKAADAITWLRLFSLPIIWWLALLGQGRLVGIGLVLAGLTDFLDGFVARRLGQESLAGARLDAVADILFLLCATIWLGTLHPEIVGENVGLITAASVIYLMSLAIGLIRFGRFGNLHLYSAKAAGGLLYVFAIATLVFGEYSRPLLTLAVSALIVSAAETTAAHVLLSVVDGRLGSVLLVWKRRAEIKTIHDIGRASRQRSQASAAKVVETSTSPSSPAERFTDNDRLTVDNCRVEPNEMWRRASAATVARMASSGPGGRPHIVPITFAIEGHVLYFGVDSKPKRTTDLKRLRNIAANPAVSILIDHYEDDWDKLWWVRLDGRARILSERDEIEQALDLLAARYRQYVTNRPSGPVVAVVIERTSTWSAAEAQP